MDKRRYQYFYRLCLVAIALNAIPTAIFQIPLIFTKGTSNPFGGVLAFIYVPLSFACWQGALIFLYMAGKERIFYQLREVMILNVLYITVCALSVGIFFVFPAVFY